MEQATNTFTKGLQMDTHPMVQGNDTLTDALNATLVTMNGNEVILQNDMGNRRVDNAFLPAGYEPVGMKEYGGIIYVAAYNPITNHSQIGSFPSPERKLSASDFDNDDLKAEFNFDDKFYGSNNIEHDNDYDLDFLKNDSFLIPLTKDLNLHVGDKFTVYATGLSEMKGRITNYDNIKEYTETVYYLWKEVEKEEFDKEYDDSKKITKYYIWEEVQQSEYDQEQDDSKKKIEIDSEITHYYLLEEVGKEEYDQIPEDKKEIKLYLKQKVSESEYNQTDSTKKSTTEINRKQPWTPKNREFTLQLGILNSQNEFVDITKSLVRWKELESGKPYITKNLIFNDEETTKIIKIDSNIIVSLTVEANSNSKLYYSTDDGNIWIEIVNFSENITVPENVNKLYLKGQNIIIKDIRNTNSNTKEWKIIDYTNESELYQFNDGYFIPDTFTNPTFDETIKDVELIQERQTISTNTYAYKLVGPLYLKVILNHIQSCDYSIDIKKEEETGDIILTATGNITYNCPDGTETSNIYNPIGEYYTKDINTFDPENTFFEIIKNTRDSYKKDSLEYDIKTTLIENNVTKISQLDKNYTRIGINPSLDANRKITEFNIDYSLYDNYIVFNENSKTFEYELNQENSFITIKIYNKYEEQNYIEINENQYECQKFKITKDNKIIIDDNEENPIIINDSTEIIIGGNINNVTLWNDNGYQIYNAPYYIRNIQINTNTNKILFSSSQGELKKLQNYTLRIYTNGEKLTSVTLNDNNTYKEIEYDVYNISSTDNIYHYEYFINLSLIDFEQYSQLVFKTSNDNPLLVNYNYGIIYIGISSSLNYCDDEIKLNKNPYGNYLFYFNEIPRLDYDKINYINTYYQNENLNETLFITRSNCLCISNNYVKFNLSKIYENYTPIVLQLYDNNFILYKLDDQKYCFQHEITLNDIENSNIQFNTYNKILITSIKVKNIQEEYREIITEPITLFEPQSYKYYYKLPSLESSDKSVIITFLSNEYSPNIGIFENKKENEDIKCESSEKTNIKYDIISNLYSLDVINKYRISSLNFSEFGYILTVKIPKQDYYLKGFTSEGIIDLNSFHSDKVEITQWATFLDYDEINNKDIIKFRFGVKNYNESNIKNIKIIVKEDDGTSSSKPEIKISINKTFATDTQITIDLLEDQYYISQEKLQKNKAYIVQKITYTLENSEEEKIIKELERDLYDYNKVIKQGNKDKELVRWFITTNLFNEFYNQTKIYDYCIPSTSKIINIVEFEKILLIENFFISISPEITLSNESININEEESINFKDVCEINHNSFNPYLKHILINNQYEASQNYEQVIIRYSLTSEDIEYIYNKGLKIYGEWNYLKHVKINNMILFNDNSQYGRYMGSGHLENLYIGSSSEINVGDILYIELYRGANLSKLEAYTYKGYWNLEIKREQNNIILNYPNNIINWLKECNEPSLIEPFDIILRKLGEKEELRVNSGKNYKIKDINQGTLKNILEIGDELGYSLDNISNKDFIIFNNNQVQINLFYMSDHQPGSSRPLNIYTFESIKNIYNDLTPSPNSGKEEIYITLIPDWHAHVGDDYHYLIIYKSNTSKGYIHGYDEIGRDGYDYLDVNKYRKDIDWDYPIPFNYDENVITDFSQRVDQILQNNNKNYNRIYLDVEGIALAKTHTDPIKHLTSNFRLYFCKNSIDGKWYPSKYCYNYDVNNDNLEATFYLSSKNVDSEGIHENYYQDSRYIQTGTSSSGILQIFFKVPMKLTYSGSFSNTTYSLGSLHFKLNQFNNLQTIDSKIINIGSKFDQQIKGKDLNQYYLKLSNGREINLNSFNDSELISKLNDKDVLYCSNYSNVKNFNSKPNLIRVTNFQNKNHQLEYCFYEKEKYSEYDYNGLYSGSGDTHSATYLIFDGAFVDDKIKTI